MTISPKKAKCIVIDFEVDSNPQAIEIRKEKLVEVKDVIKKIGSAHCGSYCL